MNNQAYGQFCGLARALEVVAEPWALMVVRDLLVAPKRFEQLRRGLPQMPDTVLSARLEEFERAGVVRRQQAPDSTGTVVYELTDYGSELEDIVLALGRWGAKALGGPRREEIVTPASMVMALRTTFRPEAARGLRLNYELRLGDIQVHARIDDGHLEAGQGPLPDVDLVIQSGPVLRALMTGETSPREAMETGGIRLNSGRSGTVTELNLLAWFAEIFHISPLPPRHHDHKPARSAQPHPAGPSRARAFSPAPRNEQVAYH